MRQRDGRAPAGFAGLRHRRGRRSHHLAVYLHRHGGNDCVGRRQAGVCGHLSGHVQHRPRKNRSENFPENQGDHSRSPVRPSRRHGPDSGHRARASPESDRRLRAGVRRDVSSTARRRLRRRGMLQLLSQQKSRLLWGRRHGDHKKRRHRRQNQNAAQPRQRDALLPFRGRL